MERRDGGVRCWIGRCDGCSSQPLNDIYNPECNSMAIKRYGFDITEWNLVEDNRCTNCGHQIPIVGGLSSAVSEERFLPVIN